MKILFTAALLLLMTVSKLSCFSVLHAPEPVCRKIPHEICKQVSRTRYESLYTLDNPCSLKPEFVQFSEENFCNGVVQQKKEERKLVDVPWKRLLEQNEGRKKVKKLQYKGFAKQNFFRLYSP